MARSKARRRKEETASGDSLGTSGFARGEPVEPRGLRAESGDITDRRDGRPWFALAIFAVALLVRLVHVWQIRRSPFYATLLGDSRGYDEWARQIAAGDWLGHEVFYQAPLYPYLLGFIYAVAGHHLLVVRVVQALIGSASCALLTLAGARALFRGRPASPPV